ncbi:MAG: hypothetical protein EHM65_09430 [Acidobacteriales bacterium]|nr:MAG: hypothetical protein EHM65_09430 [Terriglobales bacterium]
MAAGPIDFPSEPLISVWEHSAKVDIAPLVKEIGFNTVWTHDRPYDGTMKLEDTLMYRHMKTPGVKYIIAKVERGIWGWKFEEAMRHSAWIAELSLTHKEIIGLYLNDFNQEMDETAKGGHSEQEFRQIIAKVKAINPRLAIWVPCYPPRELEKPYDFDIDAIIFSFYNTKQLQNREPQLERALKKFPGKPILGSLYLNAGSEGRWLTEQEFKGLMDFFVEKVNEGKLAGIRVFRVESLNQRPEYVKWLKESLSKLKRP